MISDKSEILVIEDDLNDLETIRGMLSDMSGSFEVEGTPALSEALRLLRDKHFDAILLDLGIHDMDGLEAIKTIHGKAPQVPIIVLTGIQNEELGLSALNDGAQDYLVKGKMDGGLLARTIHHAIERRLIEQSLVLKDRAIECSIDSIGFIDMFGTIVYANGAMVGKLGYASPGELVGRNLYDVFQAKSSVMSLFNSLLENGSWTGEEQMKLKDGRMIDVQLSTTIVKNPNNDPICIMLSWTDITERKRVERALRIKDKAIAASLNGIAIADLDGRLMSVNEAFLRIIGIRDENEIIGKSIFQSHPDPMKFEKLMRSIQTQETWMGEFQLVRKDDGAKLWVQGMVNLVKDNEKKPLCIIGTFIDRTSKKKAEEDLLRSERKYRTLFDLANEGIWVTDQNDITTMVNPKMAEMLGYAPTEMIGKSIFSFVPSDQLGTAKEYVERRKEGRSEQLELQLRTNDERTIYVSTSASSIIDDQGQYAGTLAFLTDVTERKEYETKLSMSIEESNDAQERAQTFFDFLAHDIANIISPILVYSEMMTNGKTSPAKVKELGKEIATNARRASQLIVNLRKLEEIANMLPDEIERIDARQVLSDAKLFVCRSFPNKKFTISTVFPGEHPIMVKASGILDEILSRVLDNAIRYSQSDMVNVNIRVRHVKRGKDEMNWQIEIEDDGPGILPSMKKVLMTPVDPTNRLVRSVYSSLTFCYTIAKHIDGDLWIEDRVKGDFTKGTKVVLSIPECD